MNACRDLAAGLFTAGRALLSSAWGPLFGNAGEVEEDRTAPVDEPEDITFFDGSKIADGEAKAVSAKIDSLIDGDTKHILKKSLFPNYEIPPESMERFKRLDIADASGVIDPRVIKILQNTEIAVFHMLGGGAAARGAEISADSYHEQMMQQYRVGDTAGAKQSLNRMLAARVEQSAGRIRTYEQLYKAGHASISENKAGSS